MFLLLSVLMREYDYCLVGASCVDRKHFTIIKKLLLSLSGSTNTKAQAIVMRRC